jgi:MSHA biogenesis protein MshN
MGVFAMSLINKMLQDLEERRSGTEELGTLHGQVRAAPERRSDGFPWLLIFGASCAVGGAIFAGAWWMDRQPDKTPAVTAVTAQKPIVLAPSLSLKLEHTPPMLTNPVDEATLDQSPQSALAENEVRGKVVEPATHNIANPTLAGQQAGSAESPVPERSAKQSAHHTVDAGSPISAASRSAKSAADSKADLSAPPAVVKAKVDVKQDAADRSDEAEPAPLKVSKQVTELTPYQRAENDYRRALTLVEQGKSREAMGALEQALQTDARHGAARQTLAALLIDTKRPEEAVRTLSEGLSTDRAQLGLAMMLARLQVDRQDARAAIQTLQLSLPYAADRADYHAFLAALFQRETRHKEAIEHYLAALKKSPDNGIWWMGIGISLQAENRIREARDAFSRAKQSGALSSDLLAFVEQKLAQLR